ncbi:MAG: acyltransferase [Isosphaeraceae bacterium]|nr:acyltransferase [Isosphaeraceae bacterium]
MDQHLSAVRAARGAVNPRYHLLDAWRGIACLMVVIHHAGYALHWSDASTHGGSALRWWIVYVVNRFSLGVPLFFVISGYCILASVDALRRKGGSPWTFLGRRFWRIYPPYWTALLFFVALVAVLDALGQYNLHHGRFAVALDSPGVLDWPRWVGNITLTETWRPHVWGPERDIYTGIAWSLCFEEQFYFLCFLVLLVAPKRVYPALLAITAATAALRLGAWWTGQLGAMRGVFPLLWHQFAIGLAVYYRLNVAETVRERRAVDLGLLALLLVGLVSLERETVTAAAFGLVLIALKPWDQKADALAWLQPFRACGRRCYSIYLIHLPVVVVGNLGLYQLGLTGFWARTLVMIPLVSAVSVAVSWGFFNLVETHFLNPPAVRRRQPRPALDRPLAGEAVGLQA